MLNFYSWRKKIIMKCILNSQYLAVYYIILDIILFHLNVVSRGSETQYSNGLKLNFSISARQGLNPLNREHNVNNVLFRDAAFLRVEILRSS